MTCNQNDRKPDEGLRMISQADSDICLIVTGGDIDPAFAIDFIRSRAYGKVIAADNGLRFLSDAGICPDLIVGDLDTVDLAVSGRFLNDERISCDIHKPEKDETDTELALDDAIAAGFRNIEVLGALGGRIDHELANLQLLYEYRKQGAFISLIDPQNRISMAWDGRTFRKDEQYGRYLSFIPLTMEVKGITLTGFKYPLANRNITMGRSLLVSNEIAADEAQIHYSEGELIVIESCDRR